MTELKNATCELKGEYKMSGDANKVDFWVHFEGKTHGDKIDWQTYSPNPDYTSLKSAPFILGQEYNYWVWGQFGEVGEQPNHGIDGWTSGTEEITNGGKEAVLFESVHPGHLGHETGAGLILYVKLPEGRGLFKTKALNQTPGIFLMSDTCPDDGGTTPTPPDPGNPDPDPDPDPDPPPAPPTECGAPCPDGSKCIPEENRCEWIPVERNIIPACLQFQCCQNKCEEGRPDGNTNIGDGDGDGLGDCDKRPTPDPVPGSNSKNQVYLYDRLNHTFIFCCPIKADVTWLLPFDTMPPVFQRYVTTVASVRVAAQMINNPQLFQLLKDRENTLRMECMNYEMEQADLNFLNQPDHSTYMSYQTMQTLNR